ncbi:MAG: HTTM domain-containing protein [Myxococcota bacterium]
MRRRWQAWVDLMSQQERGTVLALFRIGVGLVVMYSLLSIASADLVDVLWVDEAYGGMRSLPTHHWVIELLGGATPGVVWNLWRASLLAAVAMVLGVGGRVPMLLVALLYQPLATINTDAYGGYEMLIGNATWLLLLGDCTKTLSLDCRRRTGRWVSDAHVHAWPRYVAIVQLLVVYSATGLQKLSADWVPGGSYAALYWVAHDPTWNNFDLRDWAAAAFPLTQLATALTWLFEVTALGLLFVYLLRATAERGGRLRTWANRWDLRLPWAAVGLSLHVGILVVLNVGPFSWISLCYYVCLWTPAEVERVAARVSQRLR